MRDIFVLLVIYQLKHFFADFPLQGHYMLGKFKGGTEWIRPLAAHAAVHAAFTFGISLWFVWNMTGTKSLIPFPLAILDFVVHFCVDRLKASPALGGRWKMDKPQFWWALGADQMVHHLTHYFIIWKLVTL